MKSRSIILFVLHLIVGIGAIAGGLAAIINPIDPLGVPLSLLDGSPFHSYLPIGIFLFGVIGIGNIIGSILLFLFPTFANIASFMLGLLLMLWIIIQCIIIKTVNFLHVIFFLIGFIESTLASITLRKMGLYRVKVPPSP